MILSSGKLNSTVAIVLLQLFLFSGVAYSRPKELAHSQNADVVPDACKARLKEIFEGNEFTAKSFRANWLPNGSAYLVLENNPGDNSSLLVHYDVVSGNRKVLLTSKQLVLEGDAGSFALETYTLSPDGSKILLQANRLNSDNSARYYWMLELKSGTMRNVSAGNESKISPDGTRILFTKKGNLYLFDLNTNATIPLTNNSLEDAISFGEAIFSPDGKKIAFVRTDDSNVKVRSSLIPGDPSYPEVNESKFARVGGHIPQLSIGVVDDKGLETKWLSIPVPAEGYYLGQVSWAGNSDELLVEQLSRFRDKREFFMANVSSGKVTVIFKESDPAWVVASYGKNIGLEWINRHSSFLVLSEKDGWRHAYVASRNGGDERLLTPGNFDIIERVAVDDRNGYFYYNASPENGTQKYLFRIKLDGSGEAQRISPADQTGTHDYTISPDGKWAFHTYSSSEIPPVTDLVTLPDHKVVRVLEDNAALHRKVKSVKLQAKEFIQLDIGNGIVLDAWMIKPKNFKAGSKYPVFVYVYGEPHGQTVMDTWGHAMADYHRAIADLGYLVVSFDNRGTPCPKGAAWRRAVAGSLGPLSTEEQAAAVAELGRTRSFVDLSRVGIWGWSGGGSNTLNAMFRKPDVYKVGIAVAPKPQPHLYNAWFQEIYMKTREVNPEGYKKSAPINFAEGLKGDLLIVHGSGETNTHLQITEGLVDRLIELGKPFDYMNYPNRDHGLREGKGTVLHMRLLMARYLLTHLPAGPTTK